MTSSILSPCTSASSPAALSRSIRGASKKMSSLGPLPCSSSSFSQRKKKCYLPVISAKSRRAKKAPRKVEKTDATLAMPATAPPQRPELVQVAAERDLNEDKNATSADRRGGLNAATGSRREEEEEKSAEVAVAASRDQVFQACFATSAAMGGIAVLLREGSAWASTSSGGFLPFNDCTAAIPFAPSPASLAAAAAAAGLVTAARFLLAKSWDDFANSTRTSNQQVLSNLEAMDYVWVSFLPAISEELLFRGFLLPIVGANLAGATVAGAVFGVLHLNGGRNVAFASWASIVGVGYGCLALATRDLTAPILAHALANYLSAEMWRRRLI